MFCNRPIRDRVISVGILCIVAGCRDAQEPRRIAELATVESGLEGPTVVIPETARLGERFWVEVWTVQNRYCEESAGADVRREGMTATVTPYVRTVGGPNCPGVGAYRAILAQLEFPSPGIASVLINARQDPRDAPVQTEYAITIR